MSVLKILSALASFWGFLKGWLERRRITKEARTEMERDSLKAHVDLNKEGKAIEQDADTMSDAEARTEAEKWVKD